MRAFTFLEVIIVITIVLVVGVVSSWFTTSFFFEQQTVLASQLVRASLVRASTYAMNGKAYSDWGVAFSAQEAVIFAGSTYVDRDATQDEVVSLPDGVTVEGQDEIVFARSTGITIPVTVDITGYNRTISLSVSREGAITGL